MKFEIKNYMMAEKNHSLKSKEIKILLSVLVAGLVAGVLMVFFMLYHYNPTGSYLAKNVFLDPENAYSLRYTEPGTKDKQDNRYAFEGVYYTHFDRELKKRETIPVAKAKYAQLYNLIANDQSIKEPTSYIEGLFNPSHSAALLLKVHPVGEDASKGAESIFSRIDFAFGGDYYRIRLRQSVPGNEWAYFYHPNIYREVLLRLHSN